MVYFDSLCMFKDVLSNGEAERIGSVTLNTSLIIQKSNLFIKVTRNFHSHAETVGNACKQRQPNCNPNFWLYLHGQSLVTAQINHINRNLYTLSKRCTNLKLQFWKCTSRVIVNINRFITDRYSLPPPQFVSKINFSL